MTAVQLDDDLLAPCHGCGTETLPVDWGYRAEWYMVKDEIWDAVGPGEGFLCIGCMEGRMGRRLNADDFIDAPVNDLRYRGHTAVCVELQNPQVEIQTCQSRQVNVILHYRVRRTSWNATKQQS